MGGAALLLRRVAAVVAVHLAAALSRAKCAAGLLLLGAPSTWLLPAPRGGAAVRRGRFLAASALAPRATGPSCGVALLQHAPASTLPFVLSGGSRYGCVVADAAGRSVSIRRLLATGSKAGSTRKRKASATAPPPHPAPPSVADASDTATAAGPSCPSSPTYLLQFDGGSRGNPGVSGAGAVLMLLRQPSSSSSSAITTTASSASPPTGSGDNNDDEGGKSLRTEVGTREVWVGDAHTNNYAEYVGLIEGLKMAIEAGAADVVVQGDSRLVIKQVAGEFAVRSASLRPLWEEARALLSRIPRHRLEQIPRSANGRADELANRAMDSRQTAAASSSRDAGDGAPPA